MAENTSSNRVGAGSKGTTSTTAQVPATGTTPVVNDKLQTDLMNRFKNLGINFNQPVIGPKDVFDSFSTAQKQALAKVLSKMGKGKITTSTGLRTALEEMTDITGQYKSFEQLMMNLQSDYIGALDSTPANIPTRSITQYNDEVIGKIVDNVWQSKAGALPTPEERQSQIDMIQGKFAQGTLTTSKKVYNKKTKQYENVTTSTPSYSQEQAQIDIENELKKSNPEAYNTTKALGFTDLITSTMRGGI